MEANPYNKIRLLCANCNTDIPSDRLSHDCDPERVETIRRNWALAEEEALRKIDELWENW